MPRILRVSAIAVAVASGWALPAQAQSNDAAIQQELAAMRAQMDRMAQRIDTLEGQLADARAKADTAQQVAQQAAAAATAPTITAKPATEVTWDGAPKLATKDGWSFKPRGRLQIDAAGVDAPKGFVTPLSLGYTAELRRAYIGFDGTMPGGFGYRVEADLGSGAVDLTDLYLTYKATPEITLTAGQHKPFESMEDMTSDLFTSFLERAAFNNAFNFERRVGISGQYAGKLVLVQAGAFSDNVKDLNDSNNSFSLDGRVVFMPKVLGGQLHLGGSIHYRELKDSPHAVNYAPRPFFHTTDVRLVSTANILGAEGERGYGAEFAYINGRFHATAESRWQHVKRASGIDPTFNGGYAEVGYLLTKDVTAYKNGVYDRIKPNNPLGSGGIGAIQLNARYDWLDLRDKGVVGGRQQIAGASLIWIPTAYVRFLVNYGHIWLTDAALPAAGKRDYSADAMGLRAQFDF